MVSIFPNYHPRKLILQQTKTIAEVTANENTAFCVWFSPEEYINRKKSSPKIQESL